MTAPTTAAAPAERQGPRGPAPRVRIRFAKHGKVRFTSHRDVARIWERALRRAGIPIAYTEGFSPRPKLSFGLALSTGHESHGEYLDVALREAPEPVAVERLPARLGPVLPAGIDVQSAVSLPREPTRSSRSSPAAPGTSRSATSPRPTPPPLWPGRWPRPSSPSPANARARPSPTTCGPPSSTCASSVP